MKKLEKTQSQELDQVVGAGSIKLGDDYYGKYAVKCAEGHSAKDGITEQLATKYVKYLNVHKVKCQYEGCKCAEWKVVYCQ